MQCQWIESNVHVRIAATYITVLSDVQVRIAATCITVFTVITCLTMSCLNNVTLDEDVLDEVYDMHRMLRSAFRM